MSRGPHFTVKTISEIKSLLAEGLTRQAVANRLGISKSSVHRVATKEERMAWTETKARPVDSLVGYLTELRLVHRLSQKALADKVKCDHNTIQKWENGLTSPSLRCLRAWCLGLGTTIGAAIVHSEEECATPSVITVAAKPSWEPTPRVYRRAERPATISTAPPRRPRAVIRRSQAPPQKLAPLASTKPLPSNAAWITLARSEELEEIEKFLDERGATRVPGVGDPELVALDERAPLVYDVKARRLTRRPDATRFVPRQNRGRTANPQPQ